MTSALGHNFVDFQLVLGRHNIRPPHFASKVSYSASPQASAYLIFLDFERPTLQGQKRDLIFFATFWPCRFCVSKILISFVRILVCFFILTTQEVFHLSQE